MLRLRSLPDQLIADLHCVNSQVRTTLSEPFPRDYPHFQQLVAAYERVLMHLHSPNTVELSLLQEAGLESENLDELEHTAIAHPAIESELYVLRRNLYRLDEFLEQGRTHRSVRQDLLYRSGVPEDLVEAFLAECANTHWVSCAPPEDGSAHAVLLPAQCLIGEHKAVARGGPLLAEVLRWCRRVNGYVPEAVPVATWHDSDVLDTAFLLWDPLEEGPYASFNTALEAAGRLS